MAFIFGNASAKTYGTMEVLVNGIITLPAEQGVVNKKTGGIITVVLLKLVDGKTVRCLEGQVHNRPVDFPITGHKCTVSFEEKNVDVKERDANNVLTGKTVKKDVSNVQSAVFNMTKALSIARHKGALVLDFES